MKKFIFILFSILSFTFSHSQDTFSIVAVDTITGEIGSAGASCIGAPQIPQGCYILSDVIPGVGAIHTQAYYTAANQNYAHSLMVLEVPPQQMIDSLEAHDVANNPTIRQYGIVDFYTGSPRTAAFTGVNCDDYKNHIVGSNYSIQGNILLGQQILDSMQARFLATNGELACKLMAALQGAKVIGADTRCLDDGVSSLSTFLRVAQPDDDPDDLYLDINIPSVPAGMDPIDSLQTLIDNWGGCQVSGLTATDENEGHFIYPNPAKDRIRFSLPASQLRSSTVIIYNSQGEVKLSVPAPSENVLEFDLPPGIYYLHVSKNGQHLLREKLMVVE